MVIAITCGVGVLFFLDLVAYLLRLNAFWVGERGHKEQYKLFGNEQFKALLSPQFKFVLYGSFKQTEDVLGLELCRSAAQLSERLPNHNFEYHLRLSSDSPPHWNDETLRPTLLHRPKRIYVVGGEEATKDITAALLRLGHRTSPKHHSVSLMPPC